MRLPTLLACPLAALVLFTALPGAALAQTASPAAVPAPGVAVADTRVWLTSLGGTVGEPVLRDGVTSLRIADASLPWNLTFYGCGPTLCDDIQYSAVFSGPITADQINGWNRDNRFLKAYFLPATPGGEAGAVVQYDVVLTSSGTGQLREPTVIWLQMLRTFVQGLAAPEGPPGD